jgi:hypothetical protein
MPDAQSYVYVLNATTQPLSLRVNNFDAGTVPAGKEDPTSGFVLGVLKVPRTSAPAPGQAAFGSGSGANANTMEVTAPGQDTPYENIVIDATRFPLNENMQMYLFYSAAVLCMDGIVVWGSADPEGKPPAVIHQTHGKALASA